MDERRLTAWLITEGVLSSDQVKNTLEEQIRLQRSGNVLDVVAVARRLKFLTDEQLISVAERTGYRPQGDAGRAPPPPSQISDVSQVSAASEVSDVSDAKASAEEVERVKQQHREKEKEKEKPKAYDPQVSDENVVPLSAALAKEQTAGTTSGNRKRTSGARGQSSASVMAARRRGPSVGGIGGMVAAAFMLPIAVFLLASSGRGRTSTTTPPTNTPPGTIVMHGGGNTVASASTQVLFQDLLRDLTRLETQAMSLNERETTLRSLRSVLNRLRSASLSEAQKTTLASAEKRLATVEASPPLTASTATSGGDSDFMTRDVARVEDARVEQAWSQMAGNFERILWLSLNQPRSPLQLAAEAVRGVDLRQHVSNVLREHTAKGPDGIASLVGAEDLHPVLGAGGYESLLREANRFPPELRSSERWTRWKAIIPRFEGLRERARAYAAALREGEDASVRGDLEGAKRAFSGGAYAQDPWWAAIKQYLEQPEVATAFAARAREVAAGGVAARDLPLGRPSSGGTQVLAGKNWRERFLMLAQQHRRAKVDAEKAAAKTDLERLLQETLGMAKASFDQCADIVACYDENPTVFKAETSLQPPLREHHTLYFDGAFGRATGPMSFKALDDWCSQHGYDAWRARLKPYLRLVASAASPTARAREASRRARAQTAEQVEQFSRERVGQVEDGIADVIGWMRQRGWAPADVRAELEDLVARAIERAGNPVAGARLREELRGLANKEFTPEEAAQHDKDFRKQLELVINEAVSKSLKGVERCVAAGEPGLAFDLFQYVLLLDPENDKAHKGLGHVKVEGKWVRRFEADQLRKGLAWDSKLGWVKTADKARYEKGEFWDFTTDRWTTLADANRAHADWGSCWQVQTEHFLLKSSADLAKTCEVAERLEAFYLSLFRQYDLFFAPKGAGGAAALIFGMAPSQQQPLVVNFYRNQDQFKQHANPPTDWAAGFYSGGSHASYFYDMGNSYSVTVLQHEIVHQILGETSPGGAESWLAEGAAVYLEDAFFRDGVLTLGGFNDHSRVVGYAGGFRNNNAGTELRMTEVLRLRTGAEWDSGDISKNYKGAGAVVYFFCNFDGGRYRSDFVEFLRDSYYGRGARLEDYFGLSIATLEQLMARFYDPAAAVDLPGGGSATAQDLEAARDALVNTCGAREPDLDQLAQAYGLLRDALRGADEKEANAARSRAERALLALRKKQVKVIEDAAKREQASARSERYPKLQQLRAAALQIINDTTAYPDANHGAAGQPAVDQRVNALKEVWAATPQSLTDPAVMKAFEVLDATEPWLDELEVETKKRGDESSASMRQALADAATCKGLALTEDERKRHEQDRRVREWNDAQTSVPEDCRDQVRILNDYRAMLGLHALAIDVRLYQAALKHSTYMEQTGNFDHNTSVPGRRTPSERCKAEGYDPGVGENIAFGYPSAESVHIGWYNSSGHHRNMVLTGYYQIGVGRSGTYWTQNFGMGKPDLGQ
jgi:uncharacterized protein YkwD